MSLHYSSLTSRLWQHHCYPWIFILLVLGATSVSIASPAPPITLIYSSNLDGELEPCGCSEGGNKGGIKRRVQAIDTLRQQHPDLVLISAGGLIVSELPQDQLKSQYIFKGLESLNYDAIGVQWRDLSFGADFIQRSTLPFTSANNDIKPLPLSQAIKKPSTKFAFFSWLDPNTNPQGTMASPTATQQTLSTLTQALQQAKQNNTTTILASTLTLPQAQQQFPLEWVDILIIKAKYEVFGEPQKLNHTLVLEPGSRGMRLGKLQLTLDKNQHIATWSHEVIALPPEVGDAPRMASWYDEYNAQVKVDYEKRAALRKTLETGVSPYAGEQTCQQCHQQAYKKWNASLHAEAFYVLQDANKAFDPDCLPCHTVGFEKSGGFIDTSFTPQLSHVQCESCHGAANDHVTSKGAKPVANSHWQPTQMCAQCHIQKHSPDFNFTTYWPKIAHGKPK